MNLVGLSEMLSRFQLMNLICTNTLKNQGCTLSCCSCGCRICPDLLSSSSSFRMSLKLLRVPGGQLPSSEPFEGSSAGVMGVNQADAMVVE